MLCYIYFKILESKACMVEGNGMTESMQPSCLTWNQQSEPNPFGVSFHFTDLYSVLINARKKDYNYIKLLVKQ